MKTLSLLLVSAISAVALANMDKKMTKTDVDITRSIRQEISKDTSLSPNAKNVKIVTSGDHVTLQGSVDSTTEQERVASIARMTAPGKTIDNQTEVIAP